MVHCAKTKRTRCVQEVPRDERFAPSRIQVEADERVAQLERQLAQKEIAFAALEQESLPNDSPFFDSLILKSQ